MQRDLTVREVWRLCVALAVLIGIVIALSYFAGVGFRYGFASH